MLSWMFSGKVLNVFNKDFKPKGLGCVFLPINKTSCGDSHVSHYVLCLTTIRIVLELRNSHSVNVGRSYTANQGSTRELEQQIRALIRTNTNSKTTQIIWVGGNNFGDLLFFRECTVVVLMLTFLDLFVHPQWSLLIQNTKWPFVDFHTFARLI